MDLTSWPARRHWGGCSGNAPANEPAGRRTRKAARHRPKAVRHGPKAVDDRPKAVDHRPKAVDQTSPDQLTRS
jgi:hypothetical protein